MPAAAKKTITPAPSGKSKFDQALEQYNKGGLRPNYEYKSGGPNLDKIRSTVDAVEGIAKRAADFKYQQQRRVSYDAESERMSVQRSAREAASNAAANASNRAAWEQSRMNDEIKRESFNAEQSAKASALRQENALKKVVAASRQPQTVTQVSRGGGGPVYSGVSYAGGGGGGGTDPLVLQRERMSAAARSAKDAVEAQSRLQREGAETQSRLQKERAEQSLTSQREGVEGQSRMQRERAEQSLASQREGVEGQSRLQRERTEQTSKLQAQTAAEAAGRAAGNRAAALASFQKLGRGR